MTAYFDNSATTKPCDEAVEAAKSAMLDCWGNPSSLHFKGNEAAQLLKKARKQLCSLAACDDGQFFFTSSGTTANNTAIFGAYEKLKKQGNRVVTTSLEHPSVLECMKHLEEKGVEVIRLEPDKFGKIDENAFFEVINKDTILVSCMAVNNEVGSVLPIKTIRAAVKRAGAPALIHADCVQAFGKTDISLRALDVDMITVSGHKLHALKGVGGIILKQKNIIKPYTLGGGQEQSVFSGTQAMPAIASFGAASQATMDIKGNSEKVALLKSRFLDGVADLPCVKINSPDDAIPYIANISILGLPSQPIVNFMSEKGVCISAGSACKLGHRSPVLTAMELSPEIIDSAVRISFSRFNTKDEVDALISCVREIAARYGKKQGRVL